MHDLHLDLQNGTRSNVNANRESTWDFLCWRLQYVSHLSASARYSQSKRAWPWILELHKVKCKYPSWKATCVGSNNVCPICHRLWDILVWSSQCISFESLTLKIKIRHWRFGWKCTYELILLTCTCMPKLVLLCSSICSWWHFVMDELTYTMSHRTTLFNFEVTVLKVVYHFQIISF